MSTQSAIPRPVPFASVTGGANRAGSAPKAPPYPRWKTTASAITSGFGAPRAIDPAIASGIGRGIGERPVVTPTTMSTDIASVARTP